MNTATLSVVVPVYRNEQTLPALLEQLSDLFEHTRRRLEVVFVLDGSPDNSHALLTTRLPRMPFRSTVLCLSRNFGSFAAIRSGFAIATGDRIAFLAADLQQPVSSVRAFFEMLDRGADIAIGQRATRDDPWSSRIVSALFWRLYRRFVQHDVPPGGVDAFACTAQVRDILVALPEANSTLIGLLFWVGFRREFVSYDRVKRVSGSSGWTLGRKLRYGFDSVFAFSDLPITTMIVLGFGGIVSALIAGAVIVAAWITGAGNVRGYTPIMLAILLSFSTMLLAIGLLGGYVWRIFENTKGRPSHIAQSVTTFGPAPRPVPAGERL